MKRIFLLMMSFVLALTSLNAQTIVTIGQHEMTANYPFYSPFENGRTQILYTASEIGMAGDIEGLAFNFSEIADFTFENLTIRLAHYSSSVLEATVSSALTTVYHHSLKPSSTGWQMLYFDTPFAYDGTSNLLVDICYSNSSASSYSTTSVSSMGVPSQTLFSVSTDENGCELNDLTSSYFRPNIQLSIIGVNDCVSVRPYLVSNLGTSAEVAWKANLAAKQWKVVCSTSPLENPEMAKQSMIVVEPKCNLENLSILTHYYLYIKTYCQNGDSSSWATLDFVTPNKIATLPFVCDFESDEQNSGWKTYSENANSSNGWYFGEATQNGGRRSLYISDEGGLNNHYRPVATNTAIYHDLAFAQGGYYRLSFDWKANGVVGHDAFKMLLGNPELPISDLLTQAQVLAQQSTTSSDWTHTSLLFDATSCQGTVQRFAIQWKNDASYAVQSPIAIDNLVIEPVSCPSDTPCRCLALSDVKVDNITSNSARLSWKDEGTSSLYKIYLGTDSSQLSQSIISTEKLYYSLNQLVADTVYFYKIESKCLSGEIVSTSIKSFRTLASETCASGEQCAYKIVVNENKNGSWLLCNASITMRVNGVEVGRVSPAAGHICDTFYFNACTGSQVDFILQSVYNSQAQGGFAIYDPAGNELCASSILPSFSGLLLSQVCRCNCCSIPTDLVVSKVSSHSALLSWKAGQSTRWQVLCQLDNQDIASATPVTTTQVPYLVENLLPQRTYRFFVRSFCDSLRSDWRDGGSFTTPAEPTSVPYMTGFEVETENAQWGFVRNSLAFSNEWCVDTAARRTGLKALYITNDLEQKQNQANMNVSSVTWAYRDVTFPSKDAFVVDFDWRGNGLSNQSFANVYIGEIKDIAASNNNNYTLLSSELIPVAINLCGQTEWQHKQVALKGERYAGQTKRLYFMWCNTANAGAQPPIAIDNLSIDTLHIPIGLTVDHITGKTAVAHWSGLTSNYQLELVSVKDNSVRIIEANDTVITMEGLSLFADYKCRVRSKIDDYVSAYSPYILFSACPSFDNGERVWYVSQQVGSDDNLGFDKTAPAKELATVLSSPCLQAGDVIKVAAGDYKPTVKILANQERSRTFLINKNITLEGGYNSTFTQKNLDSNLTILNGDIGVAGANNDNAYHVVYFETSANKAFLDGFVIENGYADGSESAHKNGAGVYGGTVKNCRIINNTASYLGGGIYTTNTENCLIANNAATSNGGGCYQGTHRGSIIRNNTTNSFGGGIYQGTAYQCVIDSNNAYFGGGCYNTTLYNCLVNRNIAVGNGGGKYGGNSYNCTFVYNKANNGGGQYNGAAYNSIFWANSSQYASVTLNHCAVQEKTFDATSDNITLSADNDGSQVDKHYVRFVDPLNSNFELQFESVCVNAGDNQWASASTVDLSGRDRIVEQQVDLGAYEFYNYATCRPLAQLEVVRVDGTQALLTWQGDSSYLKYRVLVKEKDKEQPFLIEETTTDSLVLTGLTLNKFYEWEVMVFCSAIDSSVYAEGPDFQACPAFDLPEHRVWFVSQQAGSVENSGVKKLQPAKELSQVLSCGCLRDGDTILMAQGTYHPTQTMLENQTSRFKTFYIHKNITVIGGYNNDFSTNDTALYATVLDGQIGSSDTDRVYHVVLFHPQTAASALLKNVSVQGGNANLEQMVTLDGSQFDMASGAGVYGGHIERCYVKNNTALKHGAGAYGSVVAHSVMENNRGQNSEFAQGGGMCGGEASNTVFRNNSNYYGGATYGTTLHNCLIERNSATLGGACYLGNLYNCTAVENEALINYGGVYGVNAVNSLFWHNYSQQGDTEYAGNFAFCALEKMSAEGNGNIKLSTLNQGNKSDEQYVRFEDPALRNYRLQYGSACMNVGCVDSISKYQYVSDLDGNPRIFDSIIDMGAYEFAHSLTCSPVTDFHLDAIDTSFAEVSWRADSAQSTFVIRIRKVDDPVSPQFYVVDETHFRFNNLEKSAEYEWSVQAICGAGDSSVFVSGPNFRACPNFDDPNHRIWYVSEKSGSANSFGTKRESPTNNIDKVLTCSCFEPGDSILVTAGNYYPSQVITLDEETFTTFFINRELTLIGGYNEDFSQYNPQQYETVLDGNLGDKEIATDNSLHVLAFKPNTEALVKGFVIKNGYNINGEGAGVLNGRIEDCQVQNNVAKSGGGMAHTTATNCLIQHNEATVSGGGAYQSVVYSSVFSNNKAQNGAGLVLGQAYQSEFHHNEASNLGGATYTSQLHSCLLHHNQAQKGGGSYASTDNNSTYIYNFAKDAGGALAAGKAYNTIVWANTSEMYQAMQCGEDEELHYCAIQDYQGNENHNVALSADNFGSDTAVAYVKFDNPANGNFHLQFGSSCINLGCNEFVTYNQDFDGNLRLLETTVDLGAFETDYSALRCKPATDLLVNNITLSSAELSWKGNSPFYKLRYRNDGQSEYKVVVLDEKNYLLTDLDATSHYEWSVMACCDLEGDSSVYVSGPSFRVCPPMLHRTWYVSQTNGSDDNYGESASSAVKSLHRLLHCTCLQEGDTILLSEGTYTPLSLDSSDARMATFLMDKNLVVKGGYSNDFNQHNPDQFATILSGDMGDAGNVYHVVTCLPFVQVKLQYLTITQGNANGDAAENQYGAAIINGFLDHCIIENNSAKQSVAYNCSASYSIFKQNVSTQKAAALVVREVEASFDNCQFIDNQGGGADVAAAESHYITMNDCQFIHNTQASALKAERVKLSRAVFYDNTGEKGGAAYLVESQVDNSLIYGNTATYGGGFYLQKGNHLLNNTIVENHSEAAGLGGGLYDEAHTSLLENNIIWGNTNASHINNIHNADSLWSTYNYNAIEDTIPVGEHNILLSHDNDGREPGRSYVRFVDAESANYLLHATSDCIDQGHAVTTMQSDLNGQTRVKGASIDLGCYESQSDNACAVPKNLVAENVTGKTAQLSWCKGYNETRWQLSYQVEGEPNTLKKIETADTVVLLTSLSGYHNYVATVKAICTANELSEASIPLYFQTPCDTASILWITTFNTFTPANQATVSSNIIPIAWNAIPKTDYYDVFVWKKGTTKPLEPTFTHLTASYCTYGNNGELVNGQTYCWQVIAHQQCMSKVSDTLCFKVVDLPDLHVTALTHNIAQAGSKLSVSWTVKNDGLGATQNAWTESLWLTRDLAANNAHSEDIRLVTINNMKDLAAGDEYSQSAEVTIPENAIGDYYLFAVANMADAYNLQIPDSIHINPYTPSVSGIPYPYLVAETHQIGNLKEVNTLDNFFFKKLDILPPPSPDLLPTQITMASQAVSGDTLTIAWSDVNQGEVNTDQPWIDAVYLSTEAAFNPLQAIYLGYIENEKPMLKQDTMLRQLLVSLPLDACGNYYVYVMTDIEDQVYEGLAENNNVARSAEMLKVTLAPAADLQVTKMLIPDSISAGGEYNINYNVINKGDTATHSSSWWDFIYLSQDTVFDAKSAQKVGEVKMSQSLVKDDSYNQQIVATIPNKLDAGDWYFYLITDAENQVVENNEANNVCRSIAAASLTLPDLIVRDLRFVDSTKTLAWEMYNQGAGAMLNQRIMYMVSINDEIYGLTEYEKLSLASEDEITCEVENIELPCTDSIRFDLLISVNRTFKETSYENNKASLSVVCAHPDLVISEAKVEKDTLQAGERVDLQWTVTNQGATLGNASFMDEVYLSATNTFNKDNAVKVAEVLHENGSMNVTAEVEIPSYLSGTYYFHLLTNANHQVCEANDNKNHFVTSSFVVNELAYADLTISKITLSDTLSVGLTSTLTYEVQNSNQSQTVVDGVWHDRIYISKEIFFDENKSIEIADIEQNRSLAKGQGYSEQVQFVLPMFLEEGKYYLFVKADADDDVFEKDLEGNNVKRSSRVVVKLYPSNLMVQKIEGKSALSWNEQADYKVTVKNAGSAATLLSQWSDALYLSTDAFFDENDVRVAIQQHDAIVAAGETYETSFSLTMPEGTDSVVYLLAIADYYHNNSDSHQEDNVLSKLVRVESTPAPDLQISGLQLLSGKLIAGQSAQLTYKVTNVGQKAVGAEVWSDKLFLQDSLQLCLHNKLKSSALAVGASYQDTLIFTIPTNYEGSQILCVKTNANCHFYESQWENNIAHLLVEVAPSLTGDLAVIDVQSNASVVQGETMQVVWTIQNQSATALRASTLSNRIFLSKDPIWDANDLLIGSAENAVFLPAGATETHSLMATTSNIEVGNYFVIVKTDATQLISEMNEENNLLASATQIRIMPVVESDTNSFALVSITPNYGGNTGAVTVELFGHHFTDNMLASLTKNEETIMADQVVSLTSEKAYAHFNLTGKSLGFYTISLQKEDSVSRLTNAFEVRTGEPATLHTNLLFPHNPRPNCIICITLEFVNEGNVDMPAPVIRLESLAGAPVSLTQYGLSEEKESLDIQLQAEDNPDNLLRPGVVYSMPIYVYTSGNLVFSIQSIQK